MTAPDTKAVACLVAVGGLSGSGKSVLAASLAPRLGATLLRTDAIRKAMAGVASDTPLPASHYTADSHVAVYGELVARAAGLLADGTSVIADGVFAKPAERAAIAEVARRSGVPFHGLWVEAPVALLRQRVAARRGDASDATLATVDKQAGYDLGEIGWTRIVNDGALAEATARAAAALGLPA
jgi:predicted kinase